MPSTIQLDAAVLAKVERVAKATGQAAADVVRRLVDEHLEDEPAPSNPPRVGGQRRGEVWMSDDFDAPPPPASTQSEQPIEARPFTLLTYGEGGTRPDIDFSSNASIQEVFDEECRLPDGTFDMTKMR